MATSGDEAIVYFEEGGPAALLTGAPAETLRAIEHGVASYRQARDPVEELARRNRATEERLRRSLDESCARTPRPGPKT